MVVLGEDTSDYVLVDLHIECLVDLSRFSRNWSFPRIELVVTRGGRHDEEDPTEFSIQGEGSDPEAAFA